MNLLYYILMPQIAQIWYDIYILHVPYVVYKQLSGNHGNLHVLLQGFNDLDLQALKHQLLKHSHYFLSPL